VVIFNGRWNIFSYIKEIEVSRKVRSIIIVLLLSSCLFGNLACSHQRSSSRSEPFFFVQMADPQFGMFTQNKGFKAETRLFEKAIAQVNRLKPAFVVICGDLTNKCGDSAQIAEFHRIAGQLDTSIPLYLVAGNHDVRKDPTPESLERYRKNYGKDYYAFRHNGCHFIVLNDSVLDRPEDVMNEMQKQLTWLENELNQSNDSTHIIILQHHPLFIENPDEDSSNTNLNRTRRRVCLDLFSKAGVTAVFAGHLHRNHIQRLGDMEIVSTASVGRPLGKDPSGFRIVKVFHDHIEHQYYDLNQVPAQVDMGIRETSVVK